MNQFEVSFYVLGYGSRSFWGPNYPRLLEIKRRYDPQNVFLVHHGVGSEEPG
jgi:FAD/FMN-containing dehydrogenase